ncbi:hypothetical protein HK104_002290 [Borealophlyctis nickersoniae]|nr:hypothetical protein HK104_002290 [Borealophlyctis nickersoniae]
MVSFYLLHRGLLHFTLVGTNFLPLLKHAMDLHFQKVYAGQPCDKVWFPSTCFDDATSDFSIYTELGCAAVIALLNCIIIGFHTGLAMYHFLCSFGRKTNGFLHGTEYGCCGAAAVFISFAAVDVEVQAAEKATQKDAKGGMWKRATRIVTAAFQVAIIVAVCAGLRIVSGPMAWDVQKTSLFVLLPCLFLNLASFVENFYEAVLMIYG